MTENKLNKAITTKEGKCKPENYISTKKCKDKENVARPSASCTLKTNPKQL